MSVRITCEEEIIWLKVALIWPRHGNEGDVRRCKKRKELQGVIKVGLAVTSSTRHNAPVTGRYTLRVVVLTGKPSYYKVACNTPCIVPRYLW